MKFVYFITLFIAVSFLGCKKYADDAFDYYQIPMPLYFALIDSSGQSLINDSNKSAIRLYYFKENKKEYIYDLNIADSLSSYGYIGVTRDAAGISARGNKIFYLESGRNDIDTIYLDVVEEKNKDCMCWFPYKSIKFNGNVPQIDLNDQLDPYLFVK